LVGTLRGWAGGKWMPEVALIAREAADELMRLQAEVNALQTEVDALRVDVARLKKPARKKKSCGSR
jgi:predicted nuclease with TOPRIM domain